MVQRQIIIETSLTIRFRALSATVGPSEMSTLLQGCEVNCRQSPSALSIICPDQNTAKALYDRFEQALLVCARAAIATEEMEVVHLRWPADRGRPLVLSLSESSPNQPQITAWGFPHLPRDAGSEQILDFIRANQTSNEEGGNGLVVTVTSMKTHKCLSANSLQAMDRGGGWSTHDWIGTNFLHLWRDSFCPGRTNYLSQLLTHLQRDWSIQDFYYQIRRPSGALAEYWTTYYIVNEFLGSGPVRVGVSKPGAWNILEGVE